MIVTDFSSALHAAFEAPDPREAVNRIKNVVAHELSQTDTRATVKKTDFFNHSFAPDLVLSWPNERERFVFLKSDTRPAVLRDDVEAIRKHDPIVFALDPVNDNPLGMDQRGESSRDDDTLLADSRGMEVLIQSRYSEPVVGLASSAVLQGGRGLLTEREAEAMASSVAAGFNGAQRLDSGATAAAVAQISGHFDRRRTSRLLRFLGAVWVGSGGMASNFPGEQDMAGDLDGTALEFLMELPPIDDFEFWRRIGRPLTLESISRLHLEDDSENLQFLVGSNLDILHARACRIIEHQPELGEEENTGFRWKLEREMLCLRGPRSTTYFAGKVDELKVEAQEGDGISLQELLRRSEARRIPISELELATPTRTVSYATVNRDDVSHDEELLKLSRTFSSTAYVQTAVASLFGSRPLVCDFPNRTGKGRTAAKFPLGTFAPVALSLLTSLTVEERLALDHVTRYYSDEQSQPALFEVDEIRVAQSAPESHYGVAARNEIES
ncbi:hypothetical protein H1V43_34155 [Streptomyces sp. PSKA54]|uniref:Uncharacterized protein n=1 Tax=Streptomyces himalayensis subsp. aureolus TaxID=2758039 RepID=A0A7W2D7N0_9ACTN|nr:hypothetical protein [Streptomyces himalayensis]MBA4866277.1 hypothetical protein [Streptomyces himalayensis subsp. aureolus]